VIESITQRRDYAILVRRLSFFGTVLSLSRQRLPRARGVGGRVLTHFQQRLSQFASPLAARWLHCR